MDEVRPVMFGGAHFSRAIGDASFFEKFPQFLPIKRKMEAMHVELSSKKGCTPCKKRRLQANLERDFAAVVASMDPASGKRFKEYFGVPRMVMHAVNPETRAAYLREI